MSLYNTVPNGMKKCDNFCDQSLLFSAFYIIFILQMSWNNGGGWGNRGGGGFGGGYGRGGHMGGGPMGGMGGGGFGGFNGPMMGGPRMGGGFNNMGGGMRGGMGGGGPNMMSPAASAALNHKPAVKKSLTLQVA